MLTRAPERQLGCAVACSCATWALAVVSARARCSAGCCAMGARASCPTPQRAGRRRALGARALNACGLRSRRGQFGRQPRRSLRGAATLEYFRCDPAVCFGRPRQFWHTGGSRPRGSANQQPAHGAALNSASAGVTCAPRRRNGSAGLESPAASAGRARALHGAQAALRSAAPR
jgi:hypothetical protein